MRHHAIRHTSTAILEGGGWGLRARAMILAATLEERGLDADLADRTLRRAAGLPPDEAHGGAPPTATEVPDNPEAVLGDLLVRIAEHGSRPAVNLVDLENLLRIWPHAARDEHPGLYARFLDSLAAPGLDAAAILRPRQMQRWQRDQPTSGDARPCAAVLEELLAAPTPEEAYRVLAGYLGADVDLPTLSWILGGLAERSMLRRFDRRGYALEVLHATATVERLAARVAPELLIVILSQLAHQLWWAHRQRMRPLDRLGDDGPADLVATIRRGDVIAAAAAARRAVGDRDRFHQSVRTAFLELLVKRADAWYPGLVALDTFAHRADHSRIGPDDGATLAASLAGAFYRAEHGSQRMAVVG